jgi:hypothetical protein
MGIILKPGKKISLSGDDIKKGGNQCLAAQQRSGWIQQGGSGVRLPNKGS